MASVAPARRRLSLLTRQDKFVLALMRGIPTAVHVFLVWFPALSSVALSFTRRNGVGGFATIEPIGSSTRGIQSGSSALTDPAPGAGKAGTSAPC